MHAWVKLQNFHQSVNKEEDNPIANAKNKPKTKPRQWGSRLPVALVLFAHRWPLSTRLPRGPAPLPGDLEVMAEAVGVPALLSPESALADSGDASGSLPLLPSCRLACV